MTVSGSATTASSSTKQRIVETALLLANEHGADAVTTRAVADTLELSPGNVSYHFPRRADLALAMAKQLSDQNDPLNEPSPETAGDLIELYRARLLNQHSFRGLVIALPTLMVSYPEVRKVYRETERTRFRQQRSQLAGLRVSGRLDADDADLDRLLSHIGFIARFWLAEYRTSYRSCAVDDVVDHYLALIADVLATCATPLGQLELDEFRSHRLPLPA